MARMRPICFSTSPSPMLVFLAISLMPGIMPMTLPIGPSFFTCPICDMKSSRVNCPFSILAGHGIQDQVNLVRRDGGVDLAQLGHELLVDREPAGGVEDDDVLALPLCLRDRRASH